MSQRVEPYRRMLLHLVRFGGVAVVVLVLTACYTDVAVQPTQTAGSLSAVTNVPTQQTQVKPPPTKGSGQGDGGGGGDSGGGGSPAAAGATAAVTRTPPSLRGSPVAPPRGSPTPVRPGTTPSGAATRPPPGRTPVATTRPQGVGTKPAGVTPPPGRTTTTGVTPSTSVTVTTTATTETGASPEPSAMIVVTKHENFANEIVAGACFALLSGETIVASACDQGEGDQNGDPGVIAIAAPPGAYTLRETTPPPGYKPAEDVQVELVAEQPLAIDVIDHLIATAEGSPSTTGGEGYFLASLVGEDGVTPLGGVCLALAGPAAYQACDGGDGDAEPTSGVIEIDAVMAGDYILTLTPPEGYEAVEPPATVTVPSGNAAQVTVMFRGTTRTTGSPTLEPTLEASPPTEEPTTESETPTETATTEATPPQVGFVIAYIYAEDGTTPVGGACLTLTGPETYQACDDGDGDADPSPGIVEIDGVAAGDYTVAVQPPPDHEAVGEAPASVHVDADQSAQLTFTFRPITTTGAVRIDKVDAVDGATPLGGACFEVSGDNGTYQACDDGDGDADELVGPDAAPGVIVINGVAAGDYTVRETQAPEGRTPGPDQQVHVDAGQVASVTVANGTPAPPETGTLAVTKVDAADGTTTLGLACFSASVADGTPIELCDDDGDGLTRFENLAPGDYTVKETKAPEGYQAAPDQTVTVAAGAEATLTFADQANVATETTTGSMAIQVQDDQGQPVPGACFDLAGPQPVHACDDVENDADATPGLILVQNLAPGEYTVTESQVPAGYRGADLQTVTIAAGAEPVPLALVNAKEPAGAALPVPVVYEDDAGRLWLLRPNDAVPTQLDSPDRPFDRSFAPVFSSDHTWVAFLVTDAANPAANMVWVKIDDLTFGGVDFASIGTPRQIAWLPGSNDTLMVAAELPGGGFNLFYYRTATSELPVTLFPADQQPARIDAIVPAPAGQLVAIQATGADGDPDVYVVNTADPAAPPLVNAGPNGDTGPDQFVAWSPAGDRLLVQSGADAPLLYVVDGAGAATPLGTSPVFAGDPSVGTAPQWSADGAWIAAFDGDPAAGGQLRFFDGNGHSPCDPIPNAIATDWSPSETRLWTLVAPPNEPVRLVAIGPDCAQQEITQLDGAPDKLLWAPNGGALAIVDRGDVTTVQLWVGDQLQAVDPAPAGVAITDVLSWSPGGEMLALFAGGPTVSIWVVTPGSPTPVAVSGSTVPEGAGYVTRVWWG